jgi:hypothetical protein
VCGGAAPRCLRNDTSFVRAAIRDRRNIYVTFDTLGI